MSRQEPKPTPDSLSISSSSLLARIQNRDGDAWGRFVLVYVPVIYGICRKSGLQATDAEDVAQEVFRSITTSVLDFKKDRNRGAFQGWLHRIVDNKVCDHYRRLGRTSISVGGSDFKATLEQLPTQDAEGSGASEMDSNDVALLRAIEVLRSEFQEMTWQAFWRLTVLGERAVDVAADLGITANRVRQARFRVMKRLRSEFAGLLPYQE